jgi:hypothetical protein
MGLSIVFNISEAVEAGLKVFWQANGTPEQIEEERNNPLRDPGYYDWLQQESLTVSIPDTDYLANIYADDDSYYVTANKWGRVYEPLTNWLKANNISWDEC